MNKVKEFVQEHGKEIVIKSACVAAGAIITIVTAKYVQRIDVGNGYYGSTERGDDYRGFSFGTELTLMVPARLKE